MKNKVRTPGRWPGRRLQRPPVRSRRSVPLLQVIDRDLSCWHDIDNNELDRAAGYLVLKTDDGGGPAPTPGWAQTRPGASTDTVGCRSQHRHQPGRGRGRPRASTPGADAETQAGQG